jgi:PAS domain S-box-containing protein
MSDVSPEQGAEHNHKPNLGLWRAIFERSLNPMLVCDDDRAILDVNPAACLLLRAPCEDLRKLRVDDLTPTEMREELASLFAAFLTQGSQAGPSTLLFPDGTRLEVEYASTANIQPGQHLSIYFAWPITGNPTRGAAAEPDYRAALAEEVGGSFTLSTREREILTLLALGDDGEKIAAQLFISPATVRTHIQNARQKLGATTRAHAIALALRDHEISIDLAAPIPSLPGGQEPPPGAEQPDRS